MMYELDPKIEKTSIHVGYVTLDKVGGQAVRFDCRLVRDNRYFWVLIIPELEGIEEIHDLSAEAFDAASKLTRHFSDAIKTATSCEKINSAAIGNVVKMLHIHVVARNAGDEAWPHPVWGRGEAKPMTKTIETWRLAVIRDAIKSFSI